VKIRIIICFLLVSLLEGTAQINPKDISSIIEWSKSNCEINIKETVDSLEKVVAVVAPKNFIENADLYLTIGKLYITYYNDPEKAFSYIERIKSLATLHSNSPLLMAKYHNSMGGLYIYEESNKELAFKEFTHSFTLLKQANIEPPYDLLSNYAVALLAQDSVEKALLYFKESRDLFFSNPSTQAIKDSSFLVLNASNHGVCYIKLGMMDSAEYYLSQAIILSKQMNHLNRIFQSTVYLGVFYQEQGRYDKAIMLLEEAISYIPNVSYKFTYKSLLFESLADTYFALENYFLAHQYRQQQIAYDDSVRNQKFTEFTYSIQYKNEIEALELKNELSEAELKLSNQQKNTRIFQLIILFLIVLMILLYVLFRIKKQREINHERARIAELEKDKIAREAEIALLRSHEKLVSAEVEMGVMERELKQLKTKLQDYLNKSHDPQFDGLQQFLKQLGHSEKKVDNLKLLDDVISFSNNQFYQRLKQLTASLTEDEIKLLTFIRLNLSQEDVLDYFGISKASLNTKRYRIRKKLQLKGSASLEDYLMQL
jgi:tetratricopeptide (TPR) repeat protein/DNA-binding CsgD family transcriptional regulator